MKTDLEYIEKTATRTLEEEKSTFGGFHYSVVGQVTAAAERYARHRDELKGRLESIGITPLAFVPTKTWGEIVGQSGLVDITLSTYSNRHNQVGIRKDGSEDMVSAVLNMVRITVALIALLPVVALTLHAVVAGLPASHQSDPAVLDFFLIGVVASIVTGVVCGFFYERFVKLWSRVYVRSVGENTVKARHLTAAVSSDSDTITDYRLPDPPEAEAEILAKLNQSVNQEQNFQRVAVAAVPEAVTLSTPVHQMVAARVTRFVMDKRAARRQKMEDWLDPIVYVTSGDAVAIVAQFGEFPIEKEVVDRVVGLEL